MLIGFGVENYGAIKGFQFISFVASALKDGTRGVIKKAYPGMSHKNYLRSIAMYGANAAGKSTFMRALATLRSIITNSYGMGAHDTLPYVPFALDDEGPSKPTSFAVEFISGENDVRYHYELSYNLTEIVEERLEVYPKGRERLLFERSRTNGIKDSESVKISKAVLPLINDNVPLLSFLANYTNLEAYDVVRPAYSWFLDELICLNRGPSGAEQIPFSGEIIDGTQGTDSARSFIQSMVKEADLGISSVHVQRRKASDAERAQLTQAAILFGAPIDNLSDTIKTVVFSHQKSDGTIVNFNMGLESDGTTRIFDLSGFIAVALERGATLVVDELDSSIHPILLSALVECFQNPDSNPNNAQLLFTAHNSVLLRGDKLRRDQIWFVQKEDGKSTAYPLTDFSVRKGEAIETGYLGGRYEATPDIPGLEDGMGLGSTRE